MSAYLGGKFGPLILIDAKYSMTVQIRQNSCASGAQGMAEQNALIVHRLVVAALLRCAAPAWQGCLLSHLIPNVIN